MITIVNQPQAVMPVYNPIYFKVSSDETTQEGFNFLFDLYVNDVFVTRTNLLPRPGTTEAVYSPARILESYLSYDINPSIVDETISSNCTAKYKVVFGEEYIDYWTYTQIAEDSVTSTSYTIVSGPTKHSFQVGDSVLIYQEPIPTYLQISGVHTVVAVFDDYSFLINVNYPHSSPTLGEPGTVTWSDKRKTEFLTDNIELVDRYFQDLGAWSTYGPDGSGNKIEISPLGSLNWTQYNSGTMVQKYTEAIGTTLKPGAMYYIKYTVYDTYPALGPQTTYVTVGGTQGTINSGTGNFSQLIKCGPTTEFRLFGESSGGGLQGITFSQVSVILIGFEAYVFNGVISYEKVPNWDYLQYEVGVINGGRFLSKQPGTASPVKTRLEDRGTIGFMNIVANDPNVEYFLFVIGEDADGTLRIPVPFLLPTLGTQPNVNSRILEVPAYPWNLNAWSQAVYSIDVIDSTVAKYRLQILAHDIALDTYDVASDTKMFSLIDCDTKFQPVRFMFLNSLGQFDYYNATLLSRTTINTTRDTYTKALGDGYQIGDRGKTVINLNSQESYTVNTNWMSEQHAEWLSYELFNSTEVYVLDNSNGRVIPIVLDLPSIEVKKRVNDSLLNYQFSYSKAVGVNTARN